MHCQWRDEGGLAHGGSGCHRLAYQEAWKTQSGDSVRDGSDRGQVLGLMKFEYEILKDRHVNSARGGNDLYHVHVHCQWRDECDWGRDGHRLVCHGIDQHEIWKDQREDSARDGSGVQAFDLMKSARVIWKD